MSDGGDSAVPADDKHGPGEVPAPGGASVAGRSTAAGQSRWKRWSIGAFTLALVAAGAVGLVKARRDHGWSLGIEGTAVPAASNTNGGAGSMSAAARAGDSLGPILELEQFLIQLAPREEDRYVRFSLALELTDEPAREAAVRRMARIRAAVLETLTDFTARDLHGRSGVEHLKDTLRGRLRHLLGGGFKNVYLVQFGVV